MARMARAAVVAAALLLAATGPALACGGLIGQNGAVNLVRTTTLAGYHDGVEHYVTSFSFAGGGGGAFGSIVPLPAVPTKVERGGSWTLQRLVRETHPPPPSAVAAEGRASAAGAPVEVVLEPASERLLSDLRSDQGMDWVPASMWLTALEVHSAAADLRYDLAVDASGGRPSPVGRRSRPQGPRRPPPSARRHHLPGQNDGHHGGGCDHRGHSDSHRLEHAAGNAGSARWNAAPGTRPCAGALEGPGPARRDRGGGGGRRLGKGCGEKTGATRRTTDRRRGR